MPTGYSQRDREFPEVPQKLLEKLEELFPNRIPTSPNVTELDFRRLQGQQAVLEKLRYHFKQQNENILEADNVLDT